MAVVRLHLLLRDDPFAHEVGHERQVLHIAAHGVEILDPRLDARDLLQLFARPLGIAPEVGFLGFLLLVEQIDPLLRDVEAPFERLGPPRELLDLIRKYHIRYSLFVFRCHSMVSPNFRAAKPSTQSAVPSMPSTDESMHRW